jgi:hypothetical protein
MLRGVVKGRQQKEGKATTSGHFVYLYLLLPEVNGIFTCVTKSRPAGIRPTPPFSRPRNYGLASIYPNLLPPKNTGRAEDNGFDAQLP